MNLKTFDTINTKMVRRGVAAIAFSFKTGSIRINKDAVELMKLSAGDEIAFCQNEADETDWYIKLLKKGGGNGFIVRDNGKPEELYLMLNSKTITEKIAGSVAFTGDGGRCQIGLEPVIIDKHIHWQLITASLRNK